jgi:hypothetical protein
LLFGSRDSLIPAGDATKAVRLTAGAIGKDSDMAGFTESVRVNTLRKILDECFGAAAAWQAMNTLWRSSPLTDGAPRPNEDQSRLPSGSASAAGQLPWIESLHDPTRVEREWLEDLGVGYC